jgi:transcriptional regulator with XRE-family HTH domain
MIIIAYIGQFGAIIRDLRDARAMPQETLAFIAGVDGAQVSKYERGIVIPSIETLIRVLRSLGQRLVVLPNLFAATAAERDAVVTAAVNWYAHGPDADLVDSVGADRALVEAVQRLVAAEIAHLKAAER